MKKEEARVIAKERVRLANEYIKGILGDPRKTYGYVSFGIEKLNEGPTCVLDIVVTYDNGDPEFERHFNLGIPNVHYDVIAEEFYKEAPDTLFPLRNVELSKIVCIIREIGDNFHGIYIENDHVSIGVNLSPSSLVKDEYNKKHDEFYKKEDIKTEKNI